MSRMILFCLMVYVASFPATASAVGDPAAGAQKNSMCQGCHGIPGYRYAYPVYHVPRLGGQHAQYIVSALKSYKEGLRPNPTMHAIAASLSEQDMEDLAAYYSGQPASDRQDRPQ